MNTEKLLTVEDVSRVLSLPPRAVRGLIRDQRLECVELPGARLRVEAAALSEFIEECKGAAARP